MLKIKDFYFKEIYNVKGKKIGVVQDVYIDFASGLVKGLKVSSHKLFSKDNYIRIEDVIEISEDILIQNCMIGSGLCFKDIKNMEVIDIDGNLKGVLEDLIIDPRDYSIKGIVISPGFIEMVTKGKEIALIDNCILGEEYILYNNKTKVIFKSMPCNMEKKNELQKV